MGGSEVTSLLIGSFHQAIGQMQVLIDDVISMCSYGRKVGRRGRAHLSHGLANKYSLPCRLWDHAANDISASCTDE